MHLVFEIFRGIGAAAGVGIRPFLPALVVAALAAGHVEIQFTHTNYDFLQQVPFLLVMVVGTVLMSVAERRLESSKMDSTAASVVLGLISAAIGALLFAGILCQGGETTWPGFVAGVVCAAIGAAATRPLFARVRKRLDKGAQGTLPLFAEAGAMLIAGLSVVAPPVGVIALLVLLWLLLTGRRREGEKYAGLRILR